MEKENEKSEEKEILLEETAPEEISKEQEEIIKEEVVEKTEKEEIKESEDTLEKEEKTVEENNNSEKIENVKENKTEGKKSKNIYILLAVFIISFIFFSVIFAVLNMNNSNVIKGVYIENVNISNLSKEDVSNLVNEKIGKLETVEVYYGEYNEVLKLEDIGLEISAKEAINKAINFGRSNNIIIDNYYILKANLFKTKFELDVRIDKEKFNEMVKNIQAELPDAVKEYSYEIEDEELIITSGKSGKAIKTEEIEEKIIENIKEQFNGNNSTIDIPVENKEPDKIDIEKIYNDVYKEAKDAYIVDDGEKFELHKEEEGIDFKISIDEAKQIISEEKETYTIPLKITKPKVEVKDLGDKLFKQTLSKFTTIYDAGDYNRSHNIALAAQTINGTILLPGETFSYNGTLGNTSKEKGYREGTAYVGGKVVKSYGGGICQVCTTLYNAVLYANLEIVERYNHSYVVNYVPAGRDATVSYGGKNFRFKNTRSYPIKIQASAKNGVVSISIKGIKEETEYEVVLTSSVISTTPNQTVYEQNPNLPAGKEKVIQKGYIGKKSIAYKTLKLNGKTISKTVLSKDTYKAMNRIVEVGTKKEVTEPAASTTPETSVPTTTQTVPESTTTVSTTPSV